MDNRLTNPKPDQRLTYLSVPFAKKDYVKAQGAKFSAKYKLWYVLKQNEQHDKLVGKFPYKPYDIVYLRVPYSDKEEAKHLGARWDKKSKLWFSPHGVTGFERWVNGEDVLSVEDEAKEAGQLTEANDNKETTTTPVIENTEKEKNEVVGEPKQVKEKKSNTKKSNTKKRSKQKKA